MYKYRVAFLVNDKQFNAWFVSPEEYGGDESSRQRFREMAKMAVKDYLIEARRVPRTGFAEALAIWPEELPVEGVLQPLDAFELKD
ncbi:MAG: hypothetical protein NC241_03860 [Bacteroides sp.]|nr:hypothetical protein [Bacteroides sp.]MCM1456780.1 hypothetical protein [Lachnoclostridium sp.]